MARPIAVATDSSGNTYVLDENEHLVRKVDSSGSMSVIAGNGQAAEPTPGPALERAIGYPLRALAADSNGNVYVASSYRVLKISPNGQLSYFAGNGEPGGPVPGTAVQSPLDSAYGVAVNSTGVLISTGTRIVKVNSAGQLTIAVGNGTQGKPTPGTALSSPLNGPQHLAIDAGGNIYFTDYLNDEDNGQSHNPRALKVSTSGQLSIIAGSGTEGNPMPGPATQSALNYPTGVAVDGAENVYLSVQDSIRSPNTNFVLKVNPIGNLSFIAGMANTRIHRSRPGDPHPATHTRRSGR